MICLSHRRSLLRHHARDVHHGPLKVRRCQPTTTTTCRRRANSKPIKKAKLHHRNPARSLCWAGMTFSCKQRQTGGNILELHKQLFYDLERGPQALRAQERAPSAPTPHISSELCREVRYRSTGWDIISAKAARLYTAIGQRIYLRGNSRPGDLVDHSMVVVVGAVHKKKATFRTEISRWFTTERLHEAAINEQNM